MKCLRNTVALVSIMLLASCHAKRSVNDATREEYRRDSITLSKERAEVRGVETVTDVEVTEWYFYPQVECDSDMAIARKGGLKKIRKMIVRSQMKESDSIKETSRTEGVTTEALHEQTVERKEENGRATANAMLIATVAAILMTVIMINKLKK